MIFSLLPFGRCNIVEAGHNIPSSASWRIWNRCDKRVSALVSATTIPYPIYVRAKPTIPYPTFVGRWNIGFELSEILEIDQIIRVWGTFSYHPRRQKGFLAEFVHDGSLWHGHFYDYLIFYNPWGNTEEIKDMQSFTLVPESGWDNFEEILKETKLVSLSTDEKVPGLSEWVLRNGICTAATYSVEYSTPIQYRFFIYQNPQETQAQFREAANFMRFHDYLFEMVQHSDPLQSGEQ